jgi:hypothetical protein
MLPQKFLLYLEANYTSLQILHVEVKNYLLKKLQLQRSTCFVLLEFRVNVGISNHTESTYFFSGACSSWQKLGHLSFAPHDAQVIIPFPLKTKNPLRRNTTLFL